MSILDLGAKDCTTCGVLKPLVDFHRDRNRQDGRRSSCKACVAEYMDDYYGGARRGDRDRAFIRANTGPFICVDPIARLGTDNKCCINCGYPVASRMAPDLYRRVVAKRPDIEDQIVIDHQREAVPA